MLTAAEISTRRYYDRKPVTIRRQQRGSHSTCTMASVSIEKAVFKGSTNALPITVAQLRGQWTCDLQVAGSSYSWAPLRSGLGQATYACVPLSPSSIIWYRPGEGPLWLGK